MKIQQAIFTSLDRGQVKGYQLVAKSDDIDRSISRELHRWSPSHLGHADPSNWTINYFPICDESVAVARTVVGGPEYSSRGGSQVVTIIAVLSNQQFAAYDNNAIYFAETAMALGWLRIPPNMPARLEAFDVPAEPFVGSFDHHRLPAMQPTENRSLARDSLRNEYRSEILHAGLAREIVAALESRVRLAIVGASHPISLVTQLILALPVPQRRECSFTTGLPPALHRPFQVHFLADSNPVLNQLLKSEGIRLIQNCG